MTIKDKVGMVLQMYPETRNSDKKLFIQYVITYHDNLVGEYDSIQLKDLFYIPSYDLISRLRRSFQEKDIYLPTDPEVMRNRNKMKSDIMAELGYRNKPQAINDNEIISKLNRVDK